MGWIRLGNINPSEVDTPPPSIASPPLTPDVVAGIIANGRRTPPTYVYTQRREPHMGPSYLMAPWDNYDAFYDLNIGWHEAPDPIRQSDFYAEGNKIHPTAQMCIVTNLALGSIQAVDEPAFRIGKLLGYFYRPMFEGTQHPSVIRANIQEAIPSTYGSQYEVKGIQPMGGIVTPTGFTVPLSSERDGYPY
jgi:hypothetical protein